MFCKTLRTFCEVLRKDLIQRGSCYVVLGLLCILLSGLKQMNVVAFSMSQS